MSTHLLAADSSKRSAGPAAQRPQLLELLVFLFLLVPAMVLSYFSRESQPGFEFLAVATMLRELALVGLIAFFLWRDGETTADAGWTVKGLAHEAAIGVALFPAVLL